jgi:predicted DCC family thiol-disulfide oxidoreductase YuxK
VTRLVPDGQLIVVFDGDCGFCTLTAAWLRRLDRGGRVALVACQDPAVYALTSLTRSDCAAAVWAVEPTGQRRCGAGAINAALTYALGWPIFLRLYAVRSVSWIQDRAYAGVVRARGWLPGVTPYCQQHPERCRPAGD